MVLAHLAAPANEASGWFRITENLEWKTVNEAYLFAQQVSNHTQKMIRVVVYIDPGGEQRSTWALPVKQATLKVMHHGRR